jgi:hypothetical protein
MDADIIEYVGVYQRRLTSSAQFPFLPVGASHNESDGVVTKQPIRRYSISCNLEGFKCRLEHLSKELTVRLTVDIFMPST